MVLEKEAEMWQKIRHAAVDLHGEAEFSAMSLQVTGDLGRRLAVVGPGF